MRPFSRLSAFDLASRGDQYGISARQWAEALALSASMGIALVWLARAGEPAGVFSMGLALVPGFVGLKHGLLPGVVAAITWGIATLVADAGAGFVPVYAMLPVGAAALAAGQARDHFRRSRRELRRQAEEQKTQLEQLYRNYNVLRASHAQLQERLAAESWSLDGAVREAELQIAERDPAGAAACLLDLLATQARVGAASVYLSSNGQLPMYPTARLGGPAHVDASHPMVRAAFQRGSLIAIDRNAADGDDVQDVLIALPLLASDGRIAGVVAIHELPFVAFHDVHFTLLSALVTRLADQLAARAEGTPTASAIIAVPPSGTTRVANAKPTSLGARRLKRQSTPGHAHSDCVGG